MKCLSWAIKIPSNAKIKPAKTPATRFFLSHNNIAATITGHSAIWVYIEKKVSSETVKCPFIHAVGAIAGTKPIVITPNVKNSKETSQKEKLICKPPQI
jgi:hypothetical protein